MISCHDWKQRNIAVENLVVSASIGIYPHEHEAPQRVRLSFDAEVALPDSLSDDFSNVLSYEVFVNTARAMMLEGHFNLLETLVDELADRVFSDTRMISLRVKGEKLDVFEDAESASVTVTWSRTLKPRSKALNSLALLRLRVESR